MNISVWYSPSNEDGISYLRFLPPEQRFKVKQSEHVDPDDGGPGLVLDFNSSGQLVGIEFLNQRNVPPSVASGNPA